MNARAHAIARAQVARMIGRTPARIKRGPLPRQHPPYLIEQEYGAALAELLKTSKVREAFAQLLAELPGMLVTAKAERGDALHSDALYVASRVRGYPLPVRKKRDVTAETAAWHAHFMADADVRVIAHRHHYDAGEGKRVRDLIEQAARKLSNSINVGSIDALAQKFAERTSTYQRIQLNRQTKAALGVDIFVGDRGLQARYAHFTAENVSLIKDLPARVAANVEKLVSRAVASAKLHPDIAEDLEKEFGFGETRSKLIARDQVGKLYGQLNASRQKDLGVVKFVWRTVEDERVRPEHDDLDNETFSYDDPPSEGLPGEPVLCRCSAEPVFDDLLDDIEGASTDEPADE